MKVFDDYAELYDLFYSGKDYCAECDYIIQLVANHSGRAVKKILDIGCGTGGHALVWAQKGYDVTGLELSVTMLAYAREKAKISSVPVHFIEGDMRCFYLGRKFDIATAMFAVMGYQTDTSNVLSTLRSIRRHLEERSLFIFDVWFGPGVIADPPKERIGYYDREGTEVLRIVRPNIGVNSHVVTVDYDILCIKDDKIEKRIHEKHEVRYFFPLEIADYAARTGFELVSSMPFMGQGDGLTTKDWNATFVLKAL
ncbi:MAG: class I SAM-dependent methyltransferase [Candidatus Brocadiaceae bacterium]|nr:class I SAM-dependent methyltransferase [Candidatus Brocadiaceae bacterium]